jgi:hypothetical protein
MQDRLQTARAAHFVGRADELRRLLLALDDDGPTLAYIHGIAGIGKTALLEAFARAARAQGASVIGLDCRTIEPTESGFLRSLAYAIGSRATSLHTISERLSRLGDRVVLSLDTYEVFRFLDTWLRESFVPLLGTNVRVVLAGREPPVAAWLTSPRRAGQIPTVALDSLSEQDALEVLIHNGIGNREAQRINRFAHGHPLALKLAGATLLDRPEVSLEGEAIPGVIDELCRLYLADVDDALTRRSLSAAGAVRRVTKPLLRAMLPDIAPDDAFEKLRDLPFVASGNDGLILHDAIRDALAIQMRAADPQTYRELRRSAWRQLQNEVRAAGPNELWRYTADLLYILENPEVREAFFPSGGPEFAVVAAKPADYDAIKAIVERHEGPDGSSLVSRWLEQRPESFFVARDKDDIVRGFYSLLLPHESDKALIETDPVARGFWRHLSENPVPTHQEPRFARYLLSMRYGEMPSPEQGALWLDIKRRYMAVRPRLRRVYIALREPASGTFSEVLDTLGFESAGSAELDQQTLFIKVNDFGPQSVDGWLARLVAEELGIEEEGVLDKHARELVLGKRRVPLTRLEFAVFEYLTDRTGRAVSRSSLIRDVWQTDYTGGSNVVEAVIRSLRRKLGERAKCIETVSGFGYRYRPNQQG